MAQEQAGNRPSAAPINQRSVVAGAVIVVLLLLGALVAAFALDGGGPGLPGDTSAEAGFARDMTVHHDQAVKMAFLIRDRTEDEIVRSMATDMILTQMNQIGQMTGWLNVWGLPLSGAEPAMTWMGHGGKSMPGLASTDELRQLADLQGEAADILFLQLMIRHHQGALPMAQAVLERSDNPVTSRLATAIINGQQVEIGTMTEMLQERGGEPLPPPE